MKALENQGVAYSYMRFSSPKQKTGDSIRRQTEARDEFVSRNKLTLDTTLHLVEEGVSAHHGKHRSSDKYALGRFVNLVTSGRIARGSYLIVENLDRLSREDVDEALQLLLTLTNAGIRVVQLIPTEIVFAKPVDQMKLMMAIMELQRGNSESAVKSDRVGKAWANKRKKARATGEAMSSSCPRWLRKEGKGYVVIPERAEVIKKIFALSADGFGMSKIIQRLIRDGHAPFGKGPHWNNSFIAHVLRGRAALGEYQPMRNREPEGDPILDFYPRVIDDKTYYRVQAGLNSRTGRGGRPSTTINLFTGLLYSVTGDKFELKTATDSRNTLFPYRTVKYINALCLSGQAKLESFPVAAFEFGVLKSLREIDPRDILPHHTPAEDDVVATAAEYEEFVSRLKKVEDQLVSGSGAADVLARAAQRITMQKDDAAKRLAIARVKASSPQSENWGTCKTLIDALEQCEDKEAARHRLKAAIARVVERVTCMFVRNGTRQIALAEFRFVGSEMRRTISIRYRQPLTARGRNVPEHRCWSTWTKKHGNVSLETDHKVIRLTLEAGCQEKTWQGAFEPDRPTTSEHIKARKAVYMKNYRKRPGD